MDGSRDDFLARAGFAGDEDRAGRGGDRFEQLEEIPHRAAAADDAVEAEALLKLLAQPGVFDAQAALLDRALQRVPQLVELKWLGDEVRGAALDDLDRVAHGTVAGDHDADDVRVAIDGGFDHARAVEARQPQIRNHDVECKVGQRLERTLRRVGLYDGEPPVR